jgi:hypothetical protein
MDFARGLVVAFLIEAEVAIVLALVIHFLGYW